MKVSRLHRYAIELLACGLKQSELAHAMGWNLAEAQTFMSVIGRAASRSNKPCKRTAGSSECSRTR